MNEDKIIDKLFKYIKIKNELSSIVFKNIYGVAIEEYIQCNLSNGKYWMEFENENYKIANPNQNRKKIVFNDGKTMDLCDWWHSGIGKLKKRLLDYDYTLDFLKKYCNFSGVDIEDRKIDIKFYNEYQNGIFYDVTFSKCSFNNLFLIGGVRFESNYYDNCTFDNVQFSVLSLNNCFFKRCLFNECNDMQSVSNHLEGEEWNELVNNRVNIDFSECIFKKCNWGFNSENSILYRNLFELTSFKMCDFINSAFYYNDFHKCYFEGVDFKNSGKLISYMNLYDIFFSNKFVGCNFKNVNFINAILLCHTLEENEYGNSTLFSLKYYENFKKLQMNLSEKEISEMNEILDNMDDEEYLKEYVSLYYNLFSEYKETVMTKRAYDFYYIYKCLGKEQKFQKLKEYPSKLYFVEWFKDFILDKTCGFGEKPYRTLGICAYVIMFSSFLFLFLGIDNSKEPILYLGIHHNLKVIFPDGYSVKSVTVGEFFSDYLTSVYFSIISFATIGYGDYSPLTLGSRILVCFQTLISIILVALFTGTMVRKAFRD